MEDLHVKKHLSSFQVIILSFAAVILLGTILLMLPISSQSRVITPLNEALFTATSAVCVTGLVVQDTASYWSAFGQTVILLLIQVGGMGVITVALSFSLVSGKKISLMQRSTMQEAIGATQVGGIVRLTSFVIHTIFVIELLGALVMMPIFVTDFGPKGIWMAVFHSISAFCNAGFDLMGTKEVPFASMTSYATHPIVIIVLMLLIVVGGIGFRTWDDVRTKRHHFKQYSMQSKVVLVTSLLLIVFPAIFFFIFEPMGVTVKERVWGAIFQAISPRTAGFNTVDLAQMSGPGQCIMIILMLIGGSPGSTAGGMKTTILAVLFANAIATFKRRESPQIFGRRIDSDVVKNAATILMMYLTLFICGGVIISVIEGIPVGTCLFETASAVGTVGLTLGITSQLGIVSQIILMILMFFGRVGGLTLIYAALSGINKNLSKLPQEKIVVG